MNIVLIPGYNRPEFMHFCLNRIKDAKNSQDYTYLFILDSGYDFNYHSIISDFQFKKIIIKRDQFSGPGKQSRNLLLGYKVATELSDDLVILIEEDIFINRDFFTFAELLSKSQKNFCSILSKNNRKHEVTTNQDTYYSGLDSDYQSLGVVWNKKILSEYILPHACDNYYRNTSLYCSSNFPNHFLKSQFTEQDGLIRRIKTEHPELPVLFPHVPRCFHAGIYGYNRTSRNKISGTLQKKIELLGGIFSDKKKYREHCQNEDFYNDSEPIENNTSHSNKLVYVKGSAI